MEATFDMPTDRYVTLTMSEDEAVALYRLLGEMSRETLTDLLWQENEADAVMDDIVQPLYDTLDALLSGV